MDTLHQVLPLLYTPSRCPAWRSAHSVKYDVEYLYSEAGLTTYLPKSDVETALPLFFPGMPVWDLTEGEGKRGQMFNANARFPMEWLWNRVKTRPKGARKAHWEAYQNALAWATRRPGSPAAQPTKAEPTATGSP